MNFRDLLNKINELSEAATDAIAQPNAQQAAVQQMSARALIKQYLRDKRNLDMVNGYYIEAETGILKNSMMANRKGLQGANAANHTTLAGSIGDLEYGDGKEFATAITDAGLTIEPTTITIKGLFKDSTKNALKINVPKLQQIASGQTVNPAPAPAPAPSPAPNTNQDAKPTEFSMDWRPKLDRLRELLNQLQKGKGQDPNPSPQPKPVPQKQSNVPIRGAGQGPGDSTLKGAPKKSQDLIRKSYDDSSSAGGAMGESIARDLVESFGYDLDEVSDTAAIGATTYAVANPLEKGLEKKFAGTAANTAAKSLAGKAAQKLLPGAATAFGTMDAIHRYKQGDYLGAGIAGTSAALALIPGVGWIPSLALDAFNIGRDLSAAPKAAPEVAQKHPPKGNTPLKQLQTAIGTAPDGIFGPKSQAALKAWQQSKGMQVTGQPTPDVFKAAGIALSEDFTRSKTVAEIIAETQYKLEQLENPLPTLYLCEDGTIFGVDSDDNVYDLTEQGLVTTGIKTGAELIPGMPKAGADFSKYAPGWERIFGKNADTVATQGTNKAAAVVPANKKAAVVPANKKATVANKKATVKQPEPQTPPPPNYSKGQMTAGPKNAPPGITPFNAGIPKAVSVGKLGAAEEKGVAALTKAEQTAVKAEVAAMKPAVKQSWIQKYPKLSKALGVVATAATATALGYLAGKDTQDPNPSPGPGPKPGPEPKPGPAPTPSIDPNDPRLAEINQLFSELIYAENPDVQKELQGYRQQFGTIMKDPNIGSLGGKGGVPGSATNAADNYQIPAN